MNKEKLQEILNNHKLWLQGEGGARADLRGANLRGASLRDADLRDADLRDADLGGANLSYADLRRANLSGADLSEADLRDAYLVGANLSGASLFGANLSGASLFGANLSGANLIDANLSGAYLRDANLSGAKYSDNTAFFALQCPEEGSFVGWKKCRNNVLVKLLIPEDAKRSSATSRKCRASKAIVLEIIGAEKAISAHDNAFVYEVGKEVFPDSFDKDRWNECSHGIHFFLTKKEAENY